MSRERKRTRRASRRNRLPDARVPPPAGGFGLPQDDDEPAALGARSSSVFPSLDPYEEEPVSAAPSAFGEEPAIGVGRPLRERPEHGNRVIGFLRGCWAELQRVQWPDRRQVAQATGVVLGFVVVAGIFLGLADEVSQQIVNAIL